MEHNQCTRRTQMFYASSERASTERRVFAHEITKEDAAKEHSVSMQSIINYVKEYMKSAGIKAIPEADASFPTRPRSGRARKYQKSPPGSNTRRSRPRLRNRRPADKRINERRLQNVDCCSRPFFKSSESARRKSSLPPIGDLSFGRGGRSQASRRRGASFHSPTRSEYRNDDALFLSDIP